MTNLMATVLITVVTLTNDIPRWTPSVCRDGPGEWMMLTDEASSPVPVLNQDGTTNSLIRIPRYLGSGQTKKDQIVRVIQTKRINELSFEWRGKSRVIKDEEILQETRMILNKKETWEPE